MIGQGSPGWSTFHRQARIGPITTTFGVIELLARQAEQEQELFLGEQIGDRVLAGGHALDQALGDGHGQRG